MRYFNKNSGKPSRAVVKVQLILAVVMMMALAGIAIPAMAMDRAEVENIGTPRGNGEPSINVTKQVRYPWDTGDWMDTVNASVGENVTFNLTVLNTGTCCNLTNMMITDNLSTSLDFLTGTSNITTPWGWNGTDPAIDVKELTWNVSKYVSVEPLETYESIYITFSANVTSCGVDVNEVTANATQEDEPDIWVSGTDNATVNTLQPSILVSKHVKDLGTGLYEETINATLGDTVEFRGLITNDGPCCNLTDIVVTDILPDGLVYADSATAKVDGGWISIEPPSSYSVNPQTNETTVDWVINDFLVSDTELAPGELITIKYSANVTGCGTGLENSQTVNASCVDAGKTVGDSDTATVEVLPEASINVTKKVWDTASGWVETVNATFGETVNFKFTILNDGNCSSLKDIWVTDTLSDSLVYNDNATVNGTPREPDIVNPPEYTWNLTGLAPLKMNESIVIEFSANVTTCGPMDINEVTANATCYEDPAQFVEGTDNATVNVVPNPSINVTKQVWDTVTEEWVETVNATVSDTVTFNCTIHNTSPCCNLTQIVVTDILSDSLEWENDFLITAPGYSASPAPTVVDKKITWNLTTLLNPLETCESIYVVFNASVISCGEDVNNVTANSTCEDDEEYWAYGEDTATVNVPLPSIEVVKLVYNPDTGQWVNVLTAAVGDTVRFRCTVRNDNDPGSYNLTAIAVWDILSDSLKYAGNAIVNGVPLGTPTFYEPDVFGWDSQGWDLEPQESIVIEFDADVFSYGHDVNRQLAASWSEECAIWVNANANAYTYTYANANPYPYTNTNANANPYPYANAYTYTYANAYANDYAETGG